MRKNLEASLCILAACGLGVPAVAASEVQLGAFLAGTCTTCHQTQAAQPAMPAIIGWDEAKFVAAMAAFRSGERPEPIMRAVAASLSDAEIAALAHYLAAQEP